MPKAAPAGPRHRPGVYVCGHCGADNTQEATDWLKSCVTAGEVAKAMHVTPRRARQLAEKDGRCVQFGPGSGRFGGGLTLWVIPAYVAWELVQRSRHYQQRHPGHAQAIREGLQRAKEQRQRESFANQPSDDW